MTGARSQARITLDLANLSQHAVMKENFVAANQGRMPNAPEGRGIVDDVNYGPVGKPARFFAGVGVPHNGFDFADAPIRHDATWKLYHLAFGDYLVDAEGTGLLNDFFVSPGEGDAGIADNWAAIRAGSAGAFPEDFKPDITQDPRSPYVSNPLDAGASKAWMLTGSYAYTLTGMYGFDELDECDPQTQHFWGGLSRPRPGQGCPRPGPANEIALEHRASWTNFRAYTFAADMRFPSRKVMFWALWAPHEEGEGWAYTYEGARTPIVMVDGSVRVCVPKSEMPIPGSPEHNQALAQGERWGVRPEIRFPGGSISPGAVGTPWFLYTEGGPEGYDFRLPTATCAWDFDVDGGVGSSDLAQLLAGEGRRFRSQDVAQMLGSWGACEPSAP